MTDWMSNFSSGILSTIIGVFIGLPAALFIDRVLRSRKQKEEKLEMIHLIQGSLEKNHNLLNQLSDNFQKQTMPFYSVDLVILDAATKDYHSMFTRSLSADLDYIRYELTHFGRKLDKMFELYDQIFNEEKTTKSFEIFKKSLSDHANIISKKIEIVKPEIEKELGKLTRLRASPSGRSARRKKSVEDRAKTST